MTETERGTPLIDGLSGFRLIGRGGTSRVYAAFDEAHQREVAVKVIDVLAESDASAARLADEVLHQANLQHPNIAPVFSSGLCPLSDGGSAPYICMMLVSGSRTLVDAVGEHGLDLPSRLRLLLDVCSAVSHAHRHALIHCDLKASNVLTEVEDQQLRVVVIDFGLARLLEGAAPGSSDAPLGGTPATMAPEQLHPGYGAVGAHTDVHALGLLLYELVTSSPARSLEDASPLWALGAALEPVPSVAGRCPQHLAGDFDRVIAKASRLEPGERYSSVEAFAQDVRAILELRPIGLRRHDRVYRLQRFVRRNPLVASLSCLVPLALAAFAIDRIDVWNELEGSRLAALAAKDEAVQRAEEADAYSGVLGDVLLAPTLSGLGPRVTLLEALNDLSQADLRSLPRAAELKARYALATGLWQSGQSDLSLAHAERALDIFDDSDVGEVVAATTLAWKLARRDGRPEAALVALYTGMETLDRLGADAYEQVQLLPFLSESWADADPAAATRASLEALRAPGAPRSWRLSRAADAATQLWRARQLDCAAELLEKELGQLTEELPLAALRGWTVMAAIRSAQQRHADVRQIDQAVRGRFVSSFPPGHPSVLDLEALHISAQLALGEHSVASELIERFELQQGVVDGQRSESAALAHRWRGRTLLLSGAGPGAAAARFQQAWRACPDDSHSGRYLRALIAVDLGLVIEVYGLPAESEELEALATFARDVLESMPISEGYMNALLLSSRLATRDGQRNEDAADHASAALEIGDALPSVADMVLSPVLLQHAVAMLTVGREAEGLRSCARLASLPGATPQDTLHALLLLSDRALDRGEHAEAERWLDQLERHPHLGSPPFDQTMLPHVWKLRARLASD